MKQRNITTQFSILQCGFWINFAILSAFASMYLMNAGLSNSAIGVVLSGGAMAAALMQPFLGAWVDQSSRFSNRHVLTFLSLVGVLVSLVLSLLPGKSPVCVGILFAADYILLQLSTPFPNAMAMEYKNAGFFMNFGIARAIGSLGYAVAAYVMGILTVRVGAGSVPAAAVLAFFSVALSAFVLIPEAKAAVSSSVDSASAPVSEEKAAGNDTEGNGPVEMGDRPLKKGDSPLDFMKKYPVFIRMLVGLVCIYFTHTLINTYAYQIILTKGGDSSDVGTAAAIAAGLELIPMLGFSVISKNAKTRQLIRISTVFFTLKILATLLVPTVMLYLVSQILQIGGWGILALSIVYYVDEVVEPENATQGQSYSGVSMTLGTVTATLICGRLLDTLGVDRTLLIGIAVGVIGTLIVFLSTPESKKPIN